MTKSSGQPALIPELVNTTEALGLLLAEAKDERALMEPGDPDPCRWVGTNTAWVVRMVSRPEDPLPCEIPGPKGRGHRFNPIAVRQWFAEELERQAERRAQPILSSPSTGLLVTASAVALDLGMAPQTMQKRLRDYQVQPVKREGTAVYFRFKDVLQTLLQVTKDEDPDSLPPVDRDAHWRAESRKDQVLKERRELVDRSEASTVLARLAGVLRDSCDLITDRLEALHLLAPEVLETVQNEMDATRRLIARRVRELQTELATGEARALDDDDEAEDQAA